MTSNYEGSGKELRDVDKFISSFALGFIHEKVVP